MVSYELGTRYSNYEDFENRLHQPYNYAKNGINKHIFSSVLLNTNNKVLKDVLTFYEKTIVFILHVVDRLHNFKNYMWVNR